MLGVQSGEILGLALEDAVREVLELGVHTLVQGFGLFFLFGEALFPLPLLLGDALAEGMFLLGKAFVETACLFGFTLSGDFYLGLQGSGFSAGRQIADNGSCDNPGG